MNHLSKALLGLVGALALTTTSASAAIICNDEGDCWRTTETYEYKPEFRVRVYADDWKWKEGEKYRWRESGKGRGYWSKGVWVEF